MNSKTTVLISGILFGMIALIHVFRLLFRWEATIAGWNVPLWLSAVAVLVGIWLCWENIKALKK